MVCRRTVENCLIRTHRHRRYIRQGCRIREGLEILIGNQPCNTSHLTHVHTVGSCTSLLLNHTDRLARRFYLDAHYGPAP
jgi:hypothetical protein